MLLKVWGTLQREAALWMFSQYHLEEGGITHEKNIKRVLGLEKDDELSFVWQFNVELKCTLNFVRLFRHIIIKKQKQTNKPKNQKAQIVEETVLLAHFSEALLTTINWADKIFEQTTQEVQPTSSSTPKFHEECPCCLAISKAQLSGLWPLCGLSHFPRRKCPLDSPP